MKIASVLVFVAMLALTLGLEANGAEAKQPPKLPATVATTDDCFTSFTGDTNRCELNYCLGSVTGERDVTTAHSYELCVSGDGGRQVASQASAEPETAKP